MERVVLCRLGQSCGLEQVKRPLSAYPFLDLSYLPVVGITDGHKYIFA